MSRPAGVDFSLILAADRTDRIAPSSSARLPALGLLDYQPQCCLPSVLPTAVGSESFVSGFLRPKVGTSPRVC